MTTPELIQLRKDLLKFRYEFSKKTNTVYHNQVQKVIDLVNMTIGKNVKK